MKRLLYLIVGLIILSTLCTAQNPSADKIPSVKLFRFGNPGDEKPAVVMADDRRLDVSAFGEDFNEAFFATGGLARLQAWLMTNSGQCALVPSNSRVASCVARPSKIVAIGLNYAEHVKEGGGPTPPEPVIFFKASSALCGPYDSVMIPKNSVKTDYEVELAIVIGKKASYVTEEEALTYVAGYSIINDYSEREWQLERVAGQWDKGKSADHFAPLGPYLVMPQDIGDPQNLSLWLKVNGVMVQESNTKMMIFKIPRLISEISKYMTLLPGDVIATGTPSGVGLGQKPPRYLKPGDVVELGIEKIGTQRQPITSAIQHFLGEAAYQDYNAWVALGVGGLPHTFEGYQTVKRLTLLTKDPLDVSRIAGDIGSRGDRKSLGHMPRRKGTRPAIAPFPIPHRQANQHNDSITRQSQKRIFDAQVADPHYSLRYKLSFYEKHNQAIALKDSASGNPTAVPYTHAEIGHIHPTDGSMHIILSPSDAKEVITKGWGEFHGLAGQRGLVKTYTMIYSPRNEQELAITKQILEAGVKYASFIPSSQ